MGTHEDTIKVNRALWEGIRDTLLSWAEHEQSIAEGVDETLLFEELCKRTTTNARHRAANYRLLANMCDNARKEEG